MNLKKNKNVQSKKRAGRLSCCRGKGGKTRKDICIKSTLPSELMERKDFRLGTLEENKIVETVILVQNKKGSAYRKWRDNNLDSNASAFLQSTGLDQSFVFPDIPSCREKKKEEQNIQLPHIS